MVFVCQTNMDLNLHNTYHLHLYKYTRGLFFIDVAATTIFLYTHQHELENNSRKIKSKQDSIQQKFQTRLIYNGVTAN